MKIPARKWCPICERRRISSKFYHSTTHSDGLMPWCRDCRSVYHSGRRKARKKPEKKPTPRGRGRLGPSIGGKHGIGRTGRNER
jgi:hypothetical protein